MAPFFAINDWSTVWNIWKFCLFRAIHNNNAFKYKHCLTDYLRFVEVYQWTAAPVFKDLIPVQQIGCAYQLFSITLCQYGKLLEGDKRKCVSLDLSLWINKVTLIVDQPVPIYLLCKSFLHAFIYSVTSLASLCSVSLAREMRSVINILRKEILELFCRLLFCLIISHTLDLLLKIVD